MEIEKTIGEMLHGYQPACVLMTANHLKIFDELKAPVSAEAVADKLGLSVKGTERLLNALTALGIVSKDSHKFHLPQDWQSYLCRDGAHSMQQWIQLSMDLQPVWNQLPEFIRYGNMVKSIMDMLGNDPHNMRAFIDAMHDKGLKATWLLARELPIGEATRMLDVGGGPGTYALEWAKLHNHLHATVFDIPPVLEVAKLYIERYGLADRVDTQPGDFNKDDHGLRPRAPRQRAAHVPARRRAGADRQSRERAGAGRPPRHPRLLHRRRRHRAGPGRAVQPQHGHAHRRRPRAPGAGKNGLAARRGHQGHPPFPRAGHSHGRAHRRQTPVTDRARARSGIRNPRSPAWLSFKNSAIAAIKVLQLGGHGTRAATFLRKRPTWGPE